MQKSPDSGLFFFYYLSLMEEADCINELINYYFIDDLRNIYPCEMVEIF